MTITGQAVFQAVNAERIAHHERALIPDKTLVDAAESKARDMVEYGYFAHYSPKVGLTRNSWWFPKGMPRELGENLAYQFSSVEDLEKAWMKSESHKNNLLYKGFTKTGIGIAHGKDGIYVVQLFSN